MLGPTVEKLIATVVRAKRKKEKKEIEVQRLFLGKLSQVAFAGMSSMLWTCVRFTP